MNNSYFLKSKIFTSTPSRSLAGRWKTQ